MYTHMYIHTHISTYIPLLPTSLRYVNKNDVEVSSEGNYYSRCPQRTLLIASHMISYS